VQTIDIENLPEDSEPLRQLVIGLQDSLEQADRRTKEAEKRLEILTEELAFFKDKLYGRRAEKWTDEDQLQARLFNEAEVGQEPVVEEPVCVEVSTHSRAKRGRKPLPESLPRVEVVHDIGEEEKLCGCGRDLVCIGREQSEKLDIIPAQIRVIRHVRLKYACRGCEGSENEGPAVTIAPAPAQMIPKGIASEGLLAYLLTAKFCDGLPFYRQEKIFSSRFEVKIPRATMCSWAMAVGRRCEPLMGLLRDEIRGGPLVRCDETPLQVLNEPGREATTKSYMWLFHGGPPGRPSVVYLYHPTRSGSVPLQYLNGYEGYVQTDGYTAYDELGKQPGITHLGCMAHVRRKFHEVTKASKKAKSAHVAMAYIRQLYSIERKAAKLELDRRQLKELRQAESLPILENFKGWLDEHVEQVPPSSLLGKAIAYARGQWDRLLVYVEDGILSPDNNIAENAIRPFCVGRKNWLFSYHPPGAAASATIFSLIETAKANGLEPYRYLRTLFQRLPLLGPEPEPCDLRALLPQYIELDDTIT